MTVISKEWKQITAELYSNTHYRGNLLQYFNLRYKKVKFTQVIYRGIVL